MAETPGGSPAAYPYATHLNVRFDQLEGRFLIDLEDGTVSLGPRQAFVVPKGIVHRTRAPERAVILMVENASIVPTGDEFMKAFSGRLQVIC